MTIMAEKKRRPVGLWAPLGLVLALGLVLGLLALGVAVLKPSSPAVGKGCVTCRVPDVPADRIGLFTWEVTTGRNTWNVELQRIYGLPEAGSTAADYSETMGDWQKLIYPPDLPAVNAALDRAYRTGNYEATFRIRRIDNGELRLIYTCGTVLYGPHGEVVAIVGSDTDITPETNSGAGPQPSSTSMLSGSAKN